MKLKSDAARRALKCFLDALAFIFPRLPRKAALKCGFLIGYFSYFILSRERKRALKNLKNAFRGEKTNDEIISIARALFCNLGRNLAEIFLFPGLTPQNIEKCVKIKGTEIIDNALKQGKGAIILTAHIGNWELMAAYLSLKGYRGSVVARRLYYEGFDEIISR
ncbi:MAG: hypothetical protein HY350_04025, partial [Candidatus Omnitrophica bacterium]|nr:hypothetical protein [Candidatus Omnitrophota bacterium]